jgi:hypothetical protein
MSRIEQRPDGKWYKWGLTLGGSKAYRALSESELKDLKKSSGGVGTSKSSGKDNDKNDGNKSGGGGKSREEQKKDERLARATSLKDTYAERIRSGGMSAAEAAAAFGQEAKKFDFGPIKTLDFQRSLEGMGSGGGGGSKSSGGGGVGGGSSPVSNKQFLSQFAAPANVTAMEMLGTDIGQKQVNDILENLRLKGIRGDETMSAFEQYLTTSPKYRDFMPSEAQRTLQYEYGNMGREASGKLSNTYKSILTGDTELQDKYNLNADSRLSISDINHLQGVDLQGVVNSGLQKVANIQAKSKMFDLIGYAFT